MPELPEIETIVRDLRPNISGKTITGMFIKAKAIKYILQTDVDNFYQGTVTHNISTVVRKGKYIIIPLSNSNVIIIHLGMTGKLILKEKTEAGLEEYMDKHTHMVIELLDYSDECRDLEIHFNDPRMFGNIWLLEDVEDIEDLDVPGLKTLGPDALGIALSVFCQIMASKRAVKAILLDQTKIAGVGNIYADEICFASGIHPAQKAFFIDEDRLMRLWFNVKFILKQGIKYRGSSVSDYVTGDGSKGSFQNYHKVYGRSGKNCINCNTVIEKIKISGRTSHFCPTCQLKNSE